MTPGRAAWACSGIRLGRVPERWQASCFRRALQLRPPGGPHCSPGSAGQQTRGSLLWELDLREAPKGLGRILPARNKASCSWKPVHLPPCAAHSKQLHAAGPGWGPETPCGSDPEISGYTGLGLRTSRAGSWSGGGGQRRGRGQRWGGGRPGQSVGGLRAPTCLVGAARLGLAPGPVARGVEGRDADQVLGMAGEVLQFGRGLGQEQHPHLLRVVLAVCLPVVDLSGGAEAGGREAQRGGAPSQPGDRWPPSRGGGPQCSWGGERASAKARPGG